MRLKITSFTKSLFFIVLLAAFINACKKDDDSDPDYVGTWAVTGTINIDEETTLDMKEVMTFTKEGFNDIIQVKNPLTNNFINYLGLKGTMSVSTNKMNATITEAGVSTFDVSGIPTGTISYYKSNQTEFTQFLSALEMPTTFQSEYQISGSQLTLKTDYNADSDFNDENEVTVYTRQ